MQARPAPAPAIIAQSWACALCTFINEDPESLLCGACESVRQRPRSSQPLLPIPAVPLFKLQSSRSDEPPLPPLPPPIPISIASAQRHAIPSSAALPAYQFDAEFDLENHYNYPAGSSSSRFRSVTEPEPDDEFGKFSAMFCISISARLFQLFTVQICFV